MTVCDRGDGGVGRLSYIPATSGFFSEMGGARASVQVPLARWRYSGHFGV